MVGLGEDTSYIQTLKTMYGVTTTVSTVGGDSKIFSITIVLPHVSTLNPYIFY